MFRPCIFSSLHVESREKWQSEKYALARSLSLQSPVQKSYRIMGKQKETGKRSQIHIHDFLASLMKFHFG